MFNKPGLVQAMDAVYIEGHPEAAVEEGHLKAAYPEDFDFNSAKTGLSWLRDNVTEQSNPYLWHAVLAAKSLLPARQSAQAYKQQVAGRRAELTVEQEAVSEADRQTRESKARKQAEYRQRFEDVLGRVREGAPHLDFDNFTELSEELIIDRKSSGLFAHAKQGFQTKLTRQVETFLDDPRTLVNDFDVIILVRNEALRLAREQPGDDLATVYVDKIFSAVSDALMGSIYIAKDFSPETVAKWLKLARPLPADISQDEVAEFCRGDNPDFNFSTTGLTMLHGRKVLARSLQRIALRQPDQFIGKAFVLAQEGLDPEDPAKVDITLAILKYGLAAKSRTPHLSPREGSDKETWVQALDLKLTLGKLGVPESLLQSNIGFAGPDDPFWKYVNTPQGKKSTLYGRLLHFNDEEQRQWAEVAPALLGSGLKRFRHRLAPKRP
jgi:hypothetical protein